MTLIDAPTSTKNTTGKRAPEKQQAKVGNNWHIGMKAHNGIDEESGLAHSIETTPADEHDIT